MKINKKSWHYWLNDVTNSKLCAELRHGNVGLCDYFWGTLKSLIKAIAILLVGIIVFIVGLFGLWFILNAIGFIITGVLGHPVSWISVDDALCVIVILSLISIMVGLFMWLSDEIEFAPDYMKIKIPPRTVKEKKPSLVGSYYSAWKDKVCPLVELED